MTWARARTALLFSLCLAALCGRPPRAVAAEPQPPPVIVAQWLLKDSHLSVVIPLTSTLTTKQKDMINGGFTTVSQLNLRLPVGNGRNVDETSAVIYGVRCSVKFDAWEETYDVARLDDRPRTALVKTFDDYGDLCLKAELDRPEILQQLALSGGTILAQLVVKQTSSEEADKIKDWLIQQQSGVMQGLFSHMLGELTLNQTVRVRISVPPKPTTVERSPSVQQPAGADREPKRKG